MMAFSCNVKCCLNPELSFLTLALVWIVTLAFSVKESAAQIQLTREIGGNVTFHCNVNKQKQIEFMYFQKGDIFVNGYHASKPLSMQTWENTQVNSSEHTVYMDALNITHNAKYDCHIQYNDRKLAKTEFILSITAQYSKPTVTISCDGGTRGFNCLVTCASHGGFPETKMTWNVPVKGNTSSHIWKVVNSSQVPNEDTRMFNSSSTANFSCSNGELNYLSCTVGEVSSDMFSVCTPRKSPDNPSPSVIAAAICSVLLIAIMVALTAFCKCKKRRRGTAAEAVAQEWRVNGYEGEEIGLSENRENEAS